MPINVCAISNVENPLFTIHYLSIWNALQAETLGHQILGEIHCKTHRLASAITCKL